MFRAVKRFRGERYSYIPAINLGSSSVGKGFQQPGSHVILNAGSKAPKLQSLTCLQCRLHLPSPGVTSPQHPTLFCALHTINGVVVRLRVLLVRAIISPKPDSLPLSLYLPDAVKLTTLQVQVCWTSEFTTQTPQAIRVSGPRSRPSSGVLRKALSTNLASRPAASFGTLRGPAAISAIAASRGVLALPKLVKLFSFGFGQLKRRCSGTRS